MNTDQDAKVFRAAFQIMKFFLDNLGSLYVPGQSGDLEAFEMPAAPGRPRLLKRRICIQVAGRAEELLDHLMLFGRGDARQISEQALMLAAMVSDRHAFFIFEDGKFRELELPRRFDVGPVLTGSLFSG
jgi:hypothetical protein